MKQFNVIWLPIVGVIVMIQWVIKGRLIPMYILEEFLIWIIYQAVLYSILFEIIFNLINNT
jgi:hypothetical protein